MKILILNYFDPFNDNNGSVLRINGVIRALKDDHELFVYSLGKTKFEYRVGNITYVTVKKSKCSKLHKLYVFLSGRSVLLDRTYNPELNKAIKELLHTTEIDLIIAESLYMAQYIPEGVRYWVDEHNVEYDLLLSYLKEKKTIFSVLKGLYLKHESKLVKRFEIKMLSDAERVLCVNSYDQTLIISEGVQAIIVPNTIDVKGVDVRFNNSTQADIVFIGTMNYYPNEYGVLYFVENVLPIIRKSGINATLWIVGANPTRKVLKLNKREDIKVTGWVELDELDNYYQVAGVFIAPMYIGGGSATKIVHAMAHSVPVVTTNIGAKKIGFLVHDENILVAENDEQFAKYVCELLSSKEMRRRIGDNARKAVEDNVDYSVVKKILNKYL